MKIINYILLILVLYSCSDNSVEVIDKEENQKVDLFPRLQLNSQKRFEYRSGAIMAGFYKTGEALWNVDSIKSESENYIYFIKETIIDTLESSGSSTKIDTSITEFKIIESISNKVTIQLYPWYCIEFDRYLDSLNVEDSIVTIKNNSFIPGTISISLKKNVGLYNLKMNESAHLAYENYDLIE